VRIETLNPQAGAVNGFFILFLYPVDMSMT